MFFTTYSRKRPVLEVGQMVCVVYIHDKALKCTRKLHCSFTVRATPNCCV